MFNIKKCIWLPLFCALICLCQPVPLSQRQQLVLISDQQLIQLGAQSYSAYLDQSDVVRGTGKARMVNRVGGRVKRAVETYMRRERLTDRIDDFEWEFALIDDSSANAFAMPGGKVAVFTGIMQIAEDDTGLAVILSHEIAHVIAHHGNERMSQALLLQLGASALSVALSEEPEFTRRLFMAAYGLGAQVGVLLPYSRLHEKEADRLGIIFMAMAGYNPNEAIDFWKRMQEKQQNGQPPAFLSTHPSYEQRIELLKENMDEAMKYYQP
ncbi:MAG: M48 family metalloprotease [Chitinivibrionales bacterium]|nr:M48 family metalloprotease [Chitinivibrionales bacterium]